MRTCAKLNSTGFRTSIVAILASATLAAPLSAKPPTPAPSPTPTASPCPISGFTSPGALGCALVDKNANDNSNAAQGLQVAAIKALDEDFVYDPSKWSDDVDPTKALFSADGDVLNFGGTLLGETIIALHFGGGSDFGNSTIFLLFDFGAPGTNSIAFTNPNGLKGYSNAALYATGTPAVPEPASWAMMLLGFGLVGMGLRSRKPKTRMQARIAF